MNALAKRELAAALFILAVALILMGGGWRAGWGSLSVPGDGFVPFLIGVLLAALSLAQVARQFRAGRQVVEGKPFLVEPGSLKRILCVLVAVSAYVALLEFLGFALATFALFLFLMRTVDPMNWRGALLVSLLVTLAGFVIFQVWLKAQLPEGLISWWRISRWIF